MRWLVLLLLLPGAAWAQDVRTYARTGALTGSQHTAPNGDTRFFDRTGRPVGSARQQGNETRFFDATGAPAGSARQDRDLTRFHDRTGAPTGTERRDALGSRTYDRTGRQVGSERRDPAGSTRFYDGSGRLEGSAR